jgi:hypothetical protein
MSEVTKIDTYVPPAADPRNPTAEQVQRLSDQAKQGVTRVSTGPDEQRPAGLPEKFKSWEDMAKAYTELEKKQGGAKQPEPKLEDKPADKPADPPAEQQKAASEAVQKAGLDVKALEAEYAQNGKLTDESMKKLEAAGFSKDIVDAYIAGQSALAEKFHGELHGIAGGETQFQQMWQWGEGALSMPEKVALNKTLDSGDQAAIKMAFQGLHSKWVSAGQNEPARPIRGGNGSEGAGDRYTHRDEVMKDMQNPEYHTNEAFRRKVVAKLKRSNVW